MVTAALNLNTVAYAASRDTAATLGVPIQISGSRITWTAPRATATYDLLDPGSLIVTKPGGMTIVPVYYPGRPSTRTPLPAAMLADVARLITSRIEPLICPDCAQRTLIQGLGHARPECQTCQIATDRPTAHLIGWAKTLTALVDLDGADGIRVTHEGCWFELRTRRQTLATSISDPDQLHLVDADIWLATRASIGEHDSAATVALYRRIATWAADQPLPADAHHRWDMLLRNRQIDAGEWDPDTASWHGWIGATSLHNDNLRSLVHVAYHDDIPLVIAPFGGDTDKGMWQTINTVLRHP